MLREGDSKVAMTRMNATQLPTRSAIDAWPLAESGVCNRAVHCLTDAGVRTVAELRLWKRSQLMELPHFGVKSYQNIQWFFRWTRRIEKNDIPVLSAPNWLREFLNKQEIHVLEQRYGLTDPLFRPHLKWRTLQEIAEASGGLTRERVRQIEESGLVKLRSRLSRALVIPLEHHWLKRLAAAGGIVTCREMTDWVGDPVLDRYQPWGFLRLLAEVSSRFRCYLDYFTLLPAETLARVERRALELLQAAREPVPFATLVTSLRAELGDYEADHERLLQVILEHHPAINGTRDGRFFLTEEATAWLLAGILRDAGTTVPLSHLRDSYNEQVLPQSQKSAQALVHVLAKLPLVRRVGTALYRWDKKD